MKNCFVIGLCLLLFSAPGQAAVLVDTTPGVTPPGYAVSAQNFTDAAINFASQGADDFTVTGNGWQIESVDVDGAYFGGVGPAESVNVYVLGNAGGLPDTTNLSAGAIYAAENLAYTDTGSGDFSITLPGGGLFLTPGTYWLVVQANMEFLVGGQWGWTESGSSNGAESAWFQTTAAVISPPAGGAATCVDAWGARVTTCTMTDPAGTPPADADLAFVLNGEVLSPGVMVSPTVLNTVEDGNTVSYDVVLTAPPVGGNTVDVTPASGDVTEGTVSGTMTFSAANWNIPQTVTVTPGASGDGNDGDVSYNITNSVSSGDPGYDGINASSVGVTNVNIDGVAVVIVDPSVGLLTTEAGGTDSFTVVLSSQPTADVTMALSSSNSNEGTISTNSLTFTNTDWNMAQTVTITGTNDDVDDGDVMYNIMIDPVVSTDPAYNGVDPQDVAVTNTDDDSAGITINSALLSTTEVGSTDDFTVVLNSEPTADVQIALNNADPSEGSLSANSLTFTAANWNTPQAVTVTGVDDDIDDGDVLYMVITDPASSADVNYAGINAGDVSVTNVDNDTAGITVNPISGLTTTEAGGTDSFTVVLNSEPTSDVMMALGSSDVTEGVISTSSLTFTSANWDTPQTVTVTGADDALDDADVVYDIVIDPATSSDAVYDGINPDDVSVTNVDDEMFAALLQASKVQSGGNFPGATVIYTIDIQNTGSGDQQDNPGAELVDVLPAELRLLGAVATSGVVDIDLPNNTVSWNGAINAGAGVTITIEAEVLAATGVTISNQGSISYDSNGDQVNDASGVTDNPATGAPDDATSFVTSRGGPTAVPMLNNWLVILLLAGMLLFAGHRQMTAKLKSN